MKKIINKEIIVRYIIFIIGLFFAGVGVAFTKGGNLGVSPISSVANVISIKYTFLSMGQWLIIWNCVLILGQILILRRNFKIYQLLQIPLSFLFGIFTDIGMWMVSYIPASNYASKLLLLFVGIVVLGFGISLSVIANVIMNSGEAIVKAISDTLNKEFGHVKVIFDISCVTMAVILSVILFHGQIVGTREGTVISACLTGFTVKTITKVIKGSVEKIIMIFR